MNIDACVIDLTLKGVEKDRAIRACVIAGYDNNKAKNKSGSISDVALEIASDSTRFAERVGTGTGSGSRDSKIASFDISNPTQLDPTLKNPIYPFPQQPEVPVLIRECMMVRTGTFNDLEINDKSINEFIKNFTQPIPIIYDHEEKVRDGYAGWVVALRKENNKLIGLCEFIGCDVVEKIQTKRLKKTSIGFYYGPTWKIFEYSLVSRPAVDDSGIIPIPEADPLSNSVSYSLHTKPILTQQEEKLSCEQEKERKDDMPPTDPVKDEPATAPKKEELSAAPTMTADQQALLSQIQAQQAQFAEQIRALSEKNQKLEEANQKLELAAKNKANADLWLTFAASGKSLPVCKDEEIAFISSLSDSQLEKYKEFKDKQGTLINYKQIADPSLDSDGKKLEKESPEYKKQREEFEALMVREHGVSFKKKKEGSQ